MDGFTRYAIYYAPQPGPLADLGRAWLGWDAEAGKGAALRPEAEWPSLPVSRRELTKAPSKYGFHGTLKPPFVLSEGREVAGLHAATAALAPRLKRLKLDGMRVDEIGPFIALVPEGDTEELAALAGTLVEALDGFRAPPSDDEIARRRAAGLTRRQEVLLHRWGYPYVMEEFRFHITLTGAIRDDATRAQVRGALARLFAPLLDRPFRIDDVCLFGEGQDGRFRNLHRYPLQG
jgi:putative phosphonate metabolism protein